jgi:hypothetical protein
VQHQFVNTAEKGMCAHAACVPVAAAQGKSSIHFYDTYVLGNSAGLGGVAALQVCRTLAVQQQQQERIGGRVGSYGSICGVPWLLGDML